MTRVCRLNRRRPSAAVSGIMSRPFWPVMNFGGAYVLGGAKRCPQVSGPLFAGLAAAACPACGPGGPGGDGEERVRDHGQGDVPVPGAVLADLVVVKAGFVFRLAEAVLDAYVGSR